MDAKLIMRYFPHFGYEHRCTQYWTVAVLLAALTYATGSTNIAVAATPRANMSWHRHETAHFRIVMWQSPTASSDNVQIDSTCEGTIARLSTYWFGRLELLNHKCDLVLYPSNESYARGVGSNAANTAGAVLIGYDTQRPFFRIDLRANRSDWETAALPHELTHVLFAQRFAGRKLPTWINEGTALLADPASKQAHPPARDYRSCAHRGYRVVIGTINVADRLPLPAGLAGVLR